MKLLFDHNLSPRLARHVSDLFPESSHVYVHGLDREDDVVVWEFAKLHGYILVTKDSDYSDLSTLRGFPPKVIWLRTGNCTTAAVERLLRKHHQAIESMGVDEDTGLVVLA
jgi:predicted nuclease of predicted toxin-antitoxin system